MFFGQEDIIFFLQQNNSDKNIFGEKESFSIKKLFLRKKAPHFCKTNSKTKRPF